VSRALSALASVIDPELRRPITELGMVGKLSETENQVEAEIKLTIIGCPAAQAIERDVRQALSKEFESVSVSMTTMSAEEREELKKKLRGDKPMKFNPFAQSDCLTRIIFVGSGKGGVGKSTLTVNLAAALAKSGFKVGLLDADIFGYSIPNLMGINQSPTKVDELMLPPIAFDVKVISIGFFVTDNKPVAWRGPMLHRAVEQFLTDVYWGDLDFLLVSGAIGLMTGQSVLGVIENLSYLETEQGKNFLFGEGGGKAVAHRLTELSGQDVRLLGQIPISQVLRASADRGVPVVVSDAEDPAAKVIEGIAAEIAKVPRGLSGKKLGLNPI